MADGGDANGNPPSDVSFPVSLVALRGQLCEWD